MEIKEIGSSSSNSRTQEQTDLARFWIATGPQNWNPVARQAAAARALTLSETARMLALLNLAGADAFIAAWDAKYTYNQWRPVTAIRAADNDGNPDTVEDASWMPLLVTPPFPDYIALHTTYAGAAQKVLEHVFGVHPRIVFALTSATAPGASRPTRPSEPSPTAWWMRACGAVSIGGRRACAADWWERRSVATPRTTS
jgi:hypothetical protein